MYILEALKETGKATNISRRYIVTQHLDGALGIEDATMSDFFPYKYLNQDIWQPYHEPVSLREAAHAVADGKKVYRNGKRLALGLVEDESILLSYSIFAHLPQDGYIINERIDA